MTVYHNMNCETGIAYGVISANNVPWLFDDIIRNGDDLSYLAWRDEIAGSLQSAVESALAEYGIDDVDDWLGADVFDRIDDIGDHFNHDESEYEYSDGDAKYRVSWLGGAPLVWVIDSKFITRCRQCSPCVPNGGDLDSPDGSWLAYCPDPDSFTDSPYVVESMEEYNGLTLVNYREGGEK